MFLLLYEAMNAQGKYFRLVALLTFLLRCSQTLTSFVLFCFVFLNHKGVGQPPLGLHVCIFPHSLL